MDADELRLAELLCSRLCHELVSPVGAVNNGVELLEEFGGDSAEAMGLIASSGKQASRRLQFYRVAFGQAGTQLAQPVADVRELLEGVFEGGKLKVQWDKSSTQAPSIPGWGKLLLNLTALAAESLPRGGTLIPSVSASATDARLSVLAAGVDCHLNAEVQQAISAGAKLEALTPRGVQPFFTARLCRRMGGHLEAADAGESKMTFSVTVPVRPE